MENEVFPPDARIGEKSDPEKMMTWVGHLTELRSRVLKSFLFFVAAFLCCYPFAGRILDVSEMNALLRQMESVPYSGQCIHGRPTYIELKLKDIERLFGRRD